MDGKQTRSFLYIDEYVEGVRRLMDSDFTRTNVNTSAPAGDGLLINPASTGSS